MYIRYFVNGCVNNALLQCCAKRIAGAVAIYCADIMSDDIIGIHKMQLSLRKSVEQKQQLVYRSETKLSSDVSITLAKMSSCTFEHTSFAR